MMNQASAYSGTLAAYQKHGVPLVGAKRLVGPRIGAQQSRCESFIAFPTIRNLRNTCRGMKTTHSPMDTLYWGSHQFLYGPLTPGEILVLEQAIFARRLGRYKQARQFWNEKLPPSHTAPVLAIEKAELEARLLRHQTGLNILEECLASQAQWRQTPSEPEIKLLTILVAAARAKVHGSLNSALLEARKMKSMWQGKSIKEWSLPEVRKKYRRPHRV